MKSSLSHIWSGPQVRLRGVVFLWGVLIVATPPLAAAAPRISPSSSSPLAGAAASPGSAPLAELGASLRSTLGETLPEGVSLIEVALRGRSPKKQLWVRLRGPKGALGGLIVSRLSASNRSAGAQGTQSLRLLLDPRQPSPSLLPALRALKVRITELDHGQFISSSPENNHARRQGNTTGGRRDPGGPPSPGLLPLTWLLLALSLFFAPAALWSAVSGVFSARDERLWRLAFVSLPLLALLLRLAAEHRLVMVYFGYLYVDQARDLLTLPRYGAATAALYHALFSLFPPHHYTVQALHVVLGSLTIWPLAALGAGFVPVDRGRIQIATLIGLSLALLPLSILDHGSESILVPAVFWWVCGVILLEIWTRKKGPWRLIGAGVLLALSGLSRPDCMALALPTALLFVGMLRGPVELWRGRWPLAGLVIGVALLSIPGLLFLQDRAREDAMMGNLPHLRPAFFLALPRELWEDWVVLHPRYYPLGATFLSLIGLGLGGGLLRNRRSHSRRSHSRRVSVAVSPDLLGEQASLGVWTFVALSVVWALPMFLDFNETSMLRLHAPSALLWTVSAVLAAAVLWSRARAWSSAWARWALGSLLVLVFLGSLLYTLPAVFARQNSDQDDDLLALVSVHSHDGQPAVYVTRSYDDLPDRGIHLFHPTYVLEQGDRWQAVSHFEAGVGRRPGERAYFLGDLRCYAHQQGSEVGARWRHPACVSLCRHHACRPVWTLELENLGERAFDWYPPPAASPHFEVGLWEITPSSGS